MIVTVFAVSYNEELMLPFFIDHYRNMFPDCRIVIYDHESTDRTVEIALKNDCEVITYSTNGELSDRKYLEIKNECWRDAKTSWVLIADIDEHCYISDIQLADEYEMGATMIRFSAFNMVNHEDNLDIKGINMGVRAPSYDKTYLFNRELITDINYTWGAHKAMPTGPAIPSRHLYICKHYKYVNLDYMVNRHAMFAKRMCEENIERGFGGHYLNSSEAIKKEFEQAKKESVHVII